MKHFFITLKILIFLIFEMNLIIKILEIKKKKNHTLKLTSTSGTYSVRIATLKLCHLTLDFTLSLSNVFYILMHLLIF